ncbi:hypothetical protein, partial [Pseudomonas gingeri]|uniref:hypothetical protein n=2 Tax=Pseudomonas gingeri TaxID=117681 RepID=UPI001C4308C9
GLTTDYRPASNPVGAGLPAITRQGTQLREVEDVAEVEPLLPNGHKKSDTRGLVSDFLEAPDWTQMLK